MNFFKLLQIFLGLIFICTIPTLTEAAVLYLEPAEGEYHQSDTFIAEVRINPEGECINTIQADLTFLKDILEVEDLSAGNSIISVWIKNPEYSNETGFISFAGGIPGGYCGGLPGSPEKSNLLGKIIFKVKEVRWQQQGEIKFLETSQVLLNDGLGTPAKLTTKGAIFTILPGVPRVSKKEWQEELERDKIPPEPFKIKISQDPLTFEGKYFITFFTTDKQTGVDYYEVKEGKKDWQKAVSPYVLEDQSLKDIIKVRAVDKAGNKRIVEYLPPTAEKSFPWWIIIILVGIGLIWWISRKLKIKNEKLQFKI